MVTCPSDKNLMKQRSFRFERSLGPTFVSENAGLALLTLIASQCLLLMRVSVRQS